MVRDWSLKGVPMGILLQPEDVCGHEGESWDVDEAPWGREVEEEVMAGGERGRNPTLGLHFASAPISDLYLLPVFNQYSPFCSILSPMGLFPPELSSSRFHTV